MQSTNSDTSYFMRNKFPWSSMLEDNWKDIKVEMVEVIWPDGKVNYFENVSANKTITAYYSKAKLKIKEPVEIETLLSKIDAIDIGLDYIHKENEFNDFKEEILLPHKLSINGPFSATADVNGDNLTVISSVMSSLHPFTSE